MRQAPGRRRGRCGGPALHRRAARALRRGAAGAIERAGGLQGFERGYESSVDLMRALPLAKQVRLIRKLHTRTRSDS